MKIISGCIIPAWILLGLLIFPQTAMTVRSALYSETFDNTTSSTNYPVNNYGWSAYLGGTGTDITANTSGDYAIVSPTDVMAIVNGATPNATAALMHTFSSALTLNTGNAISWQMGNIQANATVQVLIQIGGTGSVNSGTWYASTATYKNNASYTGSDASTPGSFAYAEVNAPGSVSFSLTFDTLANQWQTLNFTPGTSLSLGSVLGSNLTSTDITGIGFYLINAGGSTSQAMRLDTVMVVPEPNTFALVGLGGIMLVWSGLRKRR